MAGDDYTPAVGGGLKLKGVNMSSKISKHKKKKKKPKPDHPESTTYATPKDETSALIDEDAKAENESEAHAKGEDEVARSDEEAPTPSRVGKTEAELRHEERRRKRVCSCLSTFESKRSY